MKLGDCQVGDAVAVAGMPELNGVVEYLTDCRVRVRRDLGVHEVTINDRVFLAHQRKLVSWAPATEVQLLAVTQHEHV